MAKAYVVDFAASANAFLNQYDPSIAADSETPRVIVVGEADLRITPEGVWLSMDRNRPSKGDMVRGRMLVQWHHIHDIFEYEDSQAVDQKFRLGF